jgi:hypothetical protein
MPLAERRRKSRRDVPREGIESWVGLIVIAGRVRRRVASTEPPF